ncbi:MAG TPA: Ku protein [Candidatus Saccharimonadales bacterium]|nr:Ku protein [Candidatus Saccharimonadales bacterium]
MYTAVRSIAPNFIQLHAKDRSPVVRPYKCQKEDKEIPFKDIVRVVEHKGVYVEVTASDIKGALATAKNITVKQFSDPQAIDPMYYDKPYYMVPGKGGELAYTLLRDAFVKAKKIAITIFTFYEKEHIGIIMTYGGVLMLQQLRFGAELVPRADIKTPTLPQPAPNQVDVAVKLMRRYSTPFYIEDYRNEQADYIHELIERKAKGLPPKRPQRVAPHTTPEDELMPTLNALLKEQSPQYLPKHARS